MAPSFAYILKCSVSQLILTNRNFTNAGRKLEHTPQFPTAYFLPPTRALEGTSAHDQLIGPLVPSDSPWIYSFDFAAHLD